MQKPFRLGYEIIGNGNLNCLHGKSGNCRGKLKDGELTLTKANHSDLVDLWGEILREIDNQKRSKNAVEREPFHLRERKRIRQTRWRWRWRSRRRRRRRRRAGVLLPLPQRWRLLSLYVRDVFSQFCCWAFTQAQTLSLYSLSLGTLSLSPDSLSRHTPSLSLSRLSF